MRKSFLLSSIAAIATLAAAMTYSSIVSADSAKIIIKGSTTVLPITQKAIEAYPRRSWTAPATSRTRRAQ